MARDPTRRRGAPLRLRRPPPPAGRSGPIGAVGSARRQVRDAIRADRPRLVALADGLHRHPELAWQEHRSVRACAAAAGGTGLAVAVPAFGVATSFCAEAGTRGPLVVICAEYDALPGQGHGCGHNLIAAAAVGAARALAPLAGRLGGRIRLLGCPAEEGGGGKVVLARRGAFDGATAALMVHPATQDVAQPRLHAAQFLDVTCHGRAAHAAIAPERGVNALDALLIGLQSLAALRGRLPLGDKVHGIITAGGDAPNVVPACTSGTFVLRSDALDRLPVLGADVRRCFEAGALATGADVALRWRSPAYLPFLVDAPLAAAVAANMRAVGRRPVPLTRIPPTAAGSTDLANISHLVPSAHPFLAVAPPSAPLHTAAFARWATGPAAERAVVDGAMILAATAVDLWTRPELRAAITDARSRTASRRASVAVALGRSSAVAAPRPRPARAGGGAARRG